MGQLYQYFTKFIMILSIIIPTLNEEKNIGRLLESICTDYDFTQVEIIVVDNPRTTDQTRKITEKYAQSFGNIRLFEQGPERSSQRNFGAKMANGNFLFFVDADMELSRQLLTEILASISEQVALVVPERIPGESLYCKARNLEKNIYDNNEQICAARVMGKKMFDKVGCFDIKMVSGEDWDLDRRLRENGLKIKFLKNHLNHYEQDLGLIGSVRKKIYYAKNLKNYNVGVQMQVNPMFRYQILFTKPQLIWPNLLSFIYLLILKTSEFGVGFFAYSFANLSRKKSTGK